RPRFRRYRSCHAGRSRAELGRCVPGSDRSPRRGRFPIARRCSGKGRCRMSTTAVTLPPIEMRRGAGRVVGAANDSFAVAARNLIAYRRVPQLLVFSTIQPVIFVLMFRYVFGGAIKLPGNTPYVDYLMPGIFVQTVVFGSLAAAIGLAS